MFPQFAVHNDSGTEQGVEGSTIVSRSLCHAFALPLSVVLVLVRTLPNEFVAHPDFPEFLECRGDQLSAHQIPVPADLRINGFDFETQPQKLTVRNSTLETQPKKLNLRRSDLEAQT